MSVICRIALVSNPAICAPLDGLGSILAGHAIVGSEGEEARVEQLALKEVRQLGARAQPDTPTPVANPQRSNATADQKERDLRARFASAVEIG